MGATLIFPCCVPEGPAYAEAARSRGETIVAASSLTYDPTAGKFPTWFHLPSIYDSDFAARLNAAISEHDIARIYCPVLVAHVALEELGARGQLALPIIGGEDIPMRRHFAAHRELIAEATIHREFVASVTEGRSRLSAIDIAAILRTAKAIFGESDAIKIAAMIAIFADAPHGDVIEIGVLGGRSAAVLAMLASHYETGAVLAVDAWESVESIQYEVPSSFQTMVNVWRPSLPIETCFEMFLAAVLPVATHGTFNYLRATSREAYGRWSRRLQVETPEFGAVEYSGEIAVLHIDANHDHSQVDQDCALWLPHLSPGGWLILDDYVWFHGDGPRRVGDALLTERARDVRRAFVCSNALFLKLGG